MLTRVGKEGFDFKPAFVYITGAYYNGSSYMNSVTLFSYHDVKYITHAYGYHGFLGPVSWSNNTCKWYVDTPLNDTNYAHGQLNYANATYYWIAFG